MVDEHFLYNRLNMLQAEMLNFREKISPVKPQAQQNYEEESKFSVICKLIITCLLKISVCITGPLIFPTIIYYVEGNTQLFWQATAVCCTISVLLIMMVISVLCINMRKVKCVLEDAVVSLNVLAKNNPVFQDFMSDLNSEFLVKSAYRLMYPTVMMMLISIMGLLAYVKRIQFLFNISLVMLGFAGGIISTTICDIIRKRSKALPICSPNIKVEMAKTPPATNRELQFTSLIDTNPLVNLTPVNSPLLQGGLEELGVINAIPQEISPSNHHKKTFLTFPENLKCFRL